MEIAILIARVIIMILEGISASSAVSQIAGESGIDFSELWSHLPSKYR